MYKLAISLALASTALATPALARDGQWYVGLEGGPMIVEDFDYDIGDTNEAARVDSDYGYDVDGIVGYDFGAFRLEAEVGYRSVDPDEIVASAPGIPANVAGALGTGTYEINGDMSALSFMANGMLDFGQDDSIQGYVGGGAGVARVKVENVFVSSFLDDSDTGFAWQAIAGIRAPVTDNIDVGIKYRFFNAENVDLVDSAGRDIETRWRSHSVLGSLVYNFGAPAEPEEMAAPVAPPPAPVVEAPPPPPPVAEPCNTGPYIVFFDWDQSDLRPDAASVLDNAITSYANCGRANVMLAGHADKSGATTYNVGLSQRRNETVRGYLEARGISGGSVTTEAFGESRPRVDTADGVREPQNRRVEIMYGPGSGM